MSHNIRYRRFLIAAWMILFMLLFFPQEVDADGEVIRVGYTDLDEVVQNEDGTYSGYVVDYLNEVAKYTGWKYEYVYDTWGNCKEMLEKGELDLFGLMKYSPERENSFLFSELSMSDDYTVLYAKEDSDICYQEYELIDQCLIGVVEDSFYVKTIFDYIKENHLNCRVVGFETEEQALDALEGERIDLLVTTFISDVSGVKVIDQFNPVPTYFVTGKGNPELMQELDAAMKDIYIENISLERELTEKYTGNIQGGLYLTREEQEYIDSVESIEVRMFGGREPLAYTEHGKIVGILPDYMNMLGELSGLTFDFVDAKTSSVEEELQILEQDGCVFVSGSNSLNNLNLYKSNSFFENKFSYVRRKDKSESMGDDGVFAITKGMRFIGDMLSQYGYEFKVYDSSERCMEAVIDGEADMTIQYEHVTSYLMHKPRFAANLAEGIGVDYVVDMFLYASEEHALLVSILNKTINCLSEEQQVKATIDTIVSHSYSEQFDDLLYQYGWWFVLVIVLLLVVYLTYILRTRANKVNQQKKENEELQHQLSLDETTGVYNRLGFFEHARNMISLLDGDVCIIRVNIYNFKMINEIHGLEKGDMLLCEVGSLLKKIKTEKEVVTGRFAADRFYMCIAASDMGQVTLVRRLTVPWMNMDVTLTYGVYPLKGQMDIPLNVICDRADLANKSAGQMEKNYICYYSDEERIRIQREQEIESEMEKALEEEQFCIYVQPKYDIETEKIVGGEVLVRWLHPEKGLIPPFQFIELFERNGFIRKLDYYVWEQSCRFLNQIRKEGLPFLPLSVNMSRIHFYDNESIAVLCGLIEKYELKPEDLEIEVTETLCVEDSDLIFSKCRQLRRLGFKIAMDDFGSGYSSLNMLKEMPIDIIKMDLRFLSGDGEKDQEDKGRSILRTLIELSHMMELQVVIEGLETRSQKDFIKEIGTCAAQGYYYSRPVPELEYVELLQTEETDNNGLPTPPKVGNARKRRRIRELRQPMLEMVQNGDNIFVYLIPEGCGIVPDKLLQEYGLPAEIEDMSHWMVNRSLISENSVAAWLELFEAIGREEKTGSAVVEIQNRHGNYEMNWVRFDLIKDQEGDAVLAVFTIEHFGNISGQVEVLVEEKQKAYQEATTEENRRLKENEKMLKLITQHSDRVVCHYDIKKRKSRMWDKEICEQCRLPHLCETTVDHMLESGQIMPESVKDLREMFDEIADGKPKGEIRMRTTMTYGEPRWFDMQYTTIYDESGAPVSALISHKDITEQHDYEMAYLRQIQSLTETEQSLGIMEVNLTTDMIELQDSLFAPENTTYKWTTLTEFARQMVELKMLEKDQEEGLRFFSRDYMLQQYERGTRILTRIWPMRFISGEIGWVRFDIELLADPYNEHIRAFFRIWNVTDIKQKQLEIQRRSERDGMTGLLNRATAEDYIRAAISKGDNPGILVLLDLDELKQINDNYGHAEGDNAILCIANTLKTHFRESDIISRIGGDEFMVYLPGASHNSDVIKVSITVLLRKLSGMSVGTNGERKVCCSIGCAIEDEHSTFESLFDQADKALYHIKKSCKNNFAFYSSDMESDNYVLQKENLFSLDSVKKKEKSEVQELVSAITSFYQLVLSVSISGNDYYLMEEIKDGVFSKLPTFGILDNFIKLTAARIYPDDVKVFMESFSREALFAAYEQGEKSVSGTFRFQDVDGKYRSVEAIAIFYVNEEGDLCDFTFVKWID